MFAAALLLSFPAHASPNGKTGVAEAGCTCHGSTSKKTTSTLAADRESGAIGEIFNLTLVVENAEGVAAGLDVAADGGTLDNGSNNKAYDDEITHRSPQDLVDGTITFDFTWSADTPGTYTLHGAGLATNGDGEDNGDWWHKADDLTLTVEGDDTATDTGDSAVDTGDTGEPPGPCGCSHGEAPAMILPAVLAAIALRRRG